ncbi:unnamed protein product [Ilex paraguariensis]|uniref:Uncharacterized protein n=1 Tax=Ilex paraguariensis TaxID=185542 RepID=A0ABC8SKU2_9AQUA
MSKHGQTWESVIPTRVCMRESISYYVRALAMNPKADSAWQYLRISLRCASRNDMLEVCDFRNLDVLRKEFLL